MASPTTRGKYKKQALGEGLNTWGLASGLNGLFDVMDEAVHGVNEITLASVAYTLTSTNYASNDIRYRQLKFTGNFAATITIPATQNWWVVENQTGQTLTFDNGSNNATLQTGFFGLVVTNGTTVTSLTLPDGADAKTVADNIDSVNQVATDSASVIAVAGKTTEIGNLGTTAAVADLALLGTTANVTAMGELGTSANVTAMGHLGTAANVTAQGHLGTAANVTAQGHLGTAANVTNMANLSPQAVRDDMAALGTVAVRADMDALAETDVLADMASLAETDVLADMAALAETDVLADMAALGDAAVITDLDLLGTAANVTAMGHLGTAANVTAQGHLGTAANVTNMSNLGTAANVTNMNTLADIQDGTVATNAITIAATNSDNITDYSKTYLGPKNSAPTQRNDSSALQAGDLVFRTDLDQMQVRNAANNAWATVAVTASDFLTVSNNLSDLASASTARTNLGLATVASTGDYSDLSNQPTHLMVTGGSAGTIPYQTSANVTAMLAVGVAGQVLSSNGTSAPTWVNQSSGGGIATQMKFA